MNTRIVPTALLRLTVTGIAVVGLALLSGCAAVIASTGTLDGTAATIRSADQVGAAKLAEAGRHLQLARDGTEYAKTLVEREEMDNAGFAWMRAEADAELALSMTLAANAADEAQRAKDKLTALKAE